MIISSEIENVEKVENFGGPSGKSEKSILRAFARTRAKNWLLVLGLEEGLVECATLCVKSWVILTYIGHLLFTSFNM